MTSPPLLAAGFVHPALGAAGVVLAALPVIIHLLNRRRFRRVRWAAMAFLLSAKRKNARRIRLEQLLLLAVRILVILLAAWALARPFFQGDELPAGIGRAAAHRILVIDDSLSAGMSDGKGGVVFDRVREAATRLAARFGPSDGVSVVLASRPASAIVRSPSHDPREIEKLISDLRPGQAATDMLGALGLVRDIIRETRSRPGVRDVYIITDGTRAAWGAPTTGEGAFALAEIAADLEQQAKLTVVDLGPERRDNVTVGSFRPTTPAITTALPGTFLADVVNHGRVERRDLRLRVFRDEEEVASPAVPPVGPGGSQTVQFDIEFSRPGSHRLRAELIDAVDVLSTDDACFLSVDAVKRIQVLLVEGRPGIAAGTGATHYLRAALDPNVPGKDSTGIEGRVISPAELEAEPLAAVDVVVLADVRDLGPATWRRLEEYVGQGGGLVVFLGPQVEADLDSYNRLGFADGRGVLPASLVRKVRASQSGEGRSEADPGDAPAADVVRFASGPLDHPLLREFSAQGGDVLFACRIDEYVLAEVPADRAGARTVLSYTTGHPAIVTGAFGSGKVALVTTSPDMSWTNLPAKPVYPVLCLQLVMHVAPDRWGHRNVELPGSLVEDLSPRERSLPLQIVLPDGETRPVRLLAEGTRLAAKLDVTDRVGHYALEVGESRRWFAVNSSAGESDLRAVSEPALRERLGVPFEYLTEVEAVASASLASPARDLGLILLWLVLGLVLVETVLARKFGHHG